MDTHKIQQQNLLDARVCAARVHIDTDDESGIDFLLNCDSD